MKELKFNLKYIVHKKEIYFSIFILFLINLIHVLLCIIQSSGFNVYKQNYYTAEYQFILYNPFVSLSVLLIIMIPVLCSMIISDSNYLESKRRTFNMLELRINHKKNIITRLFLSFIITFTLCFLSFLFNYISLIIIYGSGNNITYFQEAPFNLLVYKSWFLDNLRLYNPVLFTLIINILVSFMYGLLVSFSYAISFYVKNRIVIYFAPLCYEIISELIFNILNLENLSIVKCLQPFSNNNIISYVMCSCIIILIIFILIKKQIDKKEIIV